MIEVLNQSLQGVEFIMFFTYATMIIGLTALFFLTILDT